MDELGILSQIRRELRKIENNFWFDKIDFATFKNQRNAITDFYYNSAMYKKLIKEKVTRVQKEMGFDDFVKDLIFAFAWKESRIDVFAVGDYEVSEKYDSNLPKQLRYSWGAFQFYAPIHGYANINGKIVKANPNAWIDMDRIRLPDIGYQIICFVNLIRQLLNRYQDETKIENKLFNVARDYNGSGKQAEIYAKSLIKIYKDREWEKWLK